MEQPLRAFLTFYKSVGDCMYEVTPIEPAALKHLKDYAVQVKL